MEREGAGVGRRGSTAAAAGSSSEVERRARYWASGNESRVVVCRIRSTRSHGAVTEEEAHEEIHGKSGCRPSRSPCEWLLFVGGDDVAVVVVGSAEVVVKKWISLRFSGPCQHHQLADVALPLRCP